MTALLPRALVVVLIAATLCAGGVLCPFSMPQETPGDDAHKCCHKGKPSNAPLTQTVNVCASQAMEAQQFSGLDLPPLSNWGFVAPMPVIAAHEAGSTVVVPQTDRLALFRTLLI